MTKIVALMAGSLVLVASSVASAKPPRPRVTTITPLTIPGRVQRPQAVQEISRAALPFSRDQLGPTLTARIGNAVSRSPF